MSNNPINRSHSPEGKLQTERDSTGESGMDVEPEQIPDGSALFGLTDNDVDEARKQYGFNELPEKKQNPILKFLSSFWGPIPWMIEIAAVLSAVVQHWEDFAVILILLVVNAVVGFWEEYQAGNTVAALKKSLAIRARVKRNGDWKTLPSRELVPKDVIHIRLGDVIPADARLLQGDPIQVDQSALTGESLPVTHNPGEVVYSGSILKQGEIDAIVTSTGQNTFFGKTAHLVESTHTVSHFQKAVLRIGNFLILLAAVLALIILGVAILRGDQLITTLQFVLILTVAAIPVAMPTVLSVTMAVGAKVLAAKKAVVTRLAAVEELAGMDTLCSDKTGTLTQNSLVLGEPFTLGGISNDELILNAALASLADSGDAIDNAILSGVKDASALKPYALVHFRPFDPVSKRTEAKVKGADGQVFLVTKGAPQVIQALVGRNEAVDHQMEKAIKAFASRGFRSLAVARGMENAGAITWSIMGIIPLFDPPRADSKATIATAQQMGINVKMVTGDQQIIAKEIAGQLGLGTNILNAEVLEKPDGDLADLVEKADGFAQVFPEHKYRIVEALQKKGKIIGMTGDGVNDAPALKIADAGIAVSGATDAARSAADIVLLTPGLSVIIDAIIESRKIFQRMKSYATYRIAETVRVLLFMTLSIIVFNFYPVTAIMIVLLALMNDGAILSIAYDNVIPSKKPEKWGMREVLTIAAILGVLGVIASFGIFYLGEKALHLDRNTIQTLIYLKLSVAGHLTIFLTRTRGHFWSNKPARILLMAVGGTQFLATMIALFGFFMTPISLPLVLMVWGYAITWFLINDQIKVLAVKYLDRKTKSA